MNKTDPAAQLRQTYAAFAAYLDTLDEEAFHFRWQDKWNAAQQLEHIVLCVAPLAQVYNMEPARIAATFGQTDRAGLDYESLKDLYLQKLKEGGAAPGQYLPVQQAAEKTALLDRLTGLIDTLAGAVEKLEEPALETLLIPHPLLGKITLKEMLYNAIYHVQHHQQQVMQYLKHA